MSPELGCINSITEPSPHTRTHTNTRPPFSVVALLWWRFLFILTIPSEFAVTNLLWRNGSRSYSKPYKSKVTHNKEPDYRFTMHINWDVWLLVCCGDATSSLAFSVSKGHLDLMKLWPCRHFSNVSHVPFGFRFFPFLFDVVTQCVSGRFRPVEVKHYRRLKTKEASASDSTSQFHLFTCYWASAADSHRSLDPKRGHIRTHHIHFFTLMCLFLFCRVLTESECWLLITWCRWL